MRTILRGAFSVLVGLVAAVLCARAVSHAALSAIEHGTPVAPTILVARLANLLLVPLTAGLVLGSFLPRRPAALAVLLVALSLVGTYLGLGAAGLPRGWKILTYVAQTAIVAVAADWMTRRRTLRGGPTGAPRDAAGLTSPEADERLEEARFARNDLTRLQLG